MKKFFLLIFVGCIPLIYSLQCYETTTDTDENTVDEKGELTTCDPGIKYCVKVVGGQTRRTCDWGACITLNYNESCGKLQYDDDTPATFCCCNTDGCNFASSLYGSSIIILLCVLHTILYIYRL